MNRTGPNTRTLTIVVVAVALAATAACSSGSTTTTEGAAPSTATSGGGTDDTAVSAKKVFKQDQTDIKIGTGETFAIRLPADPGVGDGWVLVSQPDDSFVKEDGSSFKADANAQPGAPGQMEFKFKAKKAGTTTVTFLQCDRCGGNGSTVTTLANGEPAKRLTFTITVG